MVHQTMRLATFFFRCRGFVLCVKLALAGVGHELLAFLVKGTKGKTTVNYDPVVRPIKPVNTCSICTQYLLNRVLNRCNGCLVVTQSGILLAA